jgi:hypothetical protein
MDDVIPLDPEVRERSSGYPRLSARPCSDAFLPRVVLYFWPTVNWRLQLDQGEEVLAWPAGRRDREIVRPIAKIEQPTATSTSRDLSSRSKEAFSAVGPTREGRRDRRRRRAPLQPFVGWINSPSESTDYFTFELDRSRL